MTDLNAHIRELRGIHREAMLQGRDYEQRAEEARAIFEAEFANVPDLKAQGRARASSEPDRMLPKQQRAVDYRTSMFKEMADAKGDYGVYLQRAQTYSALAQMKFAKAQAALLEIRTWQETALFRSDG